MPLPGQLGHVVFVLGSQDSELPDRLHVGIVVLCGQHVLLCVGGQLGQAGSDRLFETRSPAFTQSHFAVHHLLGIEQDDHVGRAGDALDQFCELRRCRTGKGSQEHKTNNNRNQSQFRIHETVSQVVRLYGGTVRGDKQHANVGTLRALTAGL